MQSFLKGNYSSKHRPIFKKCQINQWQNQHQIKLIIISQIIFDRYSSPFLHFTFEYGFALHILASCFLFIYSLIITIRSIHIYALIAFISDLHCIYCVLYVYIVTIIFIVTIFFIYIAHQKRLRLK